jgi:inorganic phosphate transporter, PiT family
VRFAALAAVIAAALAFTYTNGFHDAANAIATSVSTKALSPRGALLLAAAMNLVGALAGTGVAQTVSTGIIKPPHGGPGLIIVFAAVLGAIAWNVVTWRFGLPSSSTHALIGGLVGAALAASTTVFWSGVWEKVLLPMLVSPVIGGALGYLVMIAILWLFRRSHYGHVNRGFRYAQAFSAAGMALGHGLQDAQKTMGVIVLALVTAGYQTGGGIPVWVVVSCSVVIGLGTYAGGWRIIRTLGRRVVEMDPPKGFAAEVSAASVLYVTAYVWSAPISTTQSITAAVMGAGATRRLSAVRWGVAGNIAAAWLLTIPAAALVGAVAYWGTRAVVGA